MIKGYMRPDGQVGIRNYVLIIPSVVCATHVCERISSNVQGSTYLQNQYGCGQLGEDLEQTTRTLIGLGKNPNVGGVLVVGLGCELIRPEKLAKEIALSGKPVEMLIIQGAGGTSASIEQGTALARLLQEKISNIKPQPVPVSQLVLGLECGGSDTTSGQASNPALGKAADMLLSTGGSVILTEVPEMIGAEQVLVRRTANTEIAQKLMETIVDYEKKALAEGCDFRGTQPTPGNIEGGLTTIEEKSLGCVYKAGTGIIEDVIKYGEPLRVRGLTVMNAPGHDVQSMIGMLASGAQVIVFTTGRGSPTGVPIAPVIKITGNRETYSKMKENIDVFVGGLVLGETTLEEEGQKVYQSIVAAANGDLTSSERLGHREFGIWRIATTI